MLVLGYHAQHTVSSVARCARLGGVGLLGKWLGVANIKRHQYDV